MTIHDQIIEAFDTLSGHMPNDGPVMGYVSNQDTYFVALLVDDSEVDTTLFGARHYKPDEFLTVLKFATAAVILAKGEFD